MIEFTEGQDPFVNSVDVEQFSFDNLLHSLEEAAKENDNTEDVSVRSDLHTLNKELASDSDNDERSNHDSKDNRYINGSSRLDNVCGMSYENISSEGLDSVEVISVSLVKTTSEVDGVKTKRRDVFSCFTHHHPDEIDWESFFQCTQNEIRDHALHQHRRTVAAQEL